MKKNRFFALTAFCAGLFLASCSQEDIVSTAPENSQISDKAHVEMAIADVKTSGPATRAAITPVTAWASAADKNIGVTVYKTKAATDLMFSETINQKWTYNAGSWSTTNTPIMYNGDGGFVTAYYPWSDATDPKAVSIDNTKDWMYSKISDSQQVDYFNHTVSLTMSHATTQIKVNIYRKGYHGTGNLTSISVKGDKFATAATLNSLTGQLSNHTPVAKFSDETLDLTLGEMGGGGISDATLALHESFVPIDDEACTVQFDAIVDGIKLRVKVDDQLFEKGKVYTYKLNVTDILENPMEIQEVEIKPWDEVEGADEDLVEFIPAEKKAIDLGLPSGLKWAQGNLGTEEETEPGLYYMWGEIEGHEKGSGYEFTTANYEAKELNLITTNLTLAQDAANVRLGGDWRMPTKAEFEELYNNTDVTWVANFNGTGVSGRKFVNRSDDSKYIFMPAAGNYGGSSLGYWGSVGYYWSSTFLSASDAWRFGFLSSGQIVSSNYRYYGFSVRGVCQ